MKTINKAFHLICLAVLLGAASSSEAQTPTKSRPAQGQPPRPLVQQPDGHWSANQPSGTEGYEVHTVKAGDTLWDITRQYLKDPFLWPQLWEINPKINNPHWIYPGDRVLIKKMVVMTPPPPETTPQVRAEEPRPSPSPAPPAPSVAATETKETETEPGAVTPPSPPAVATYSDLYCSGYFSAERVAAKATLIGGEESENRSLFTDRDVVYLNQGTAAGIKPGDELQVVRLVTEFAKWGTDFAKAKSKDRYGHYYQDIGRLRVLLAQEGSATAEIVFACEEMTVGDLVLPGEERVSPLQKAESTFDKFAPATNKTTGRIFMSKEFRRLIGNGGVVYVDVGGKQNVQAGDYFQIVRHFYKENISLFNRGDYGRYRQTFDTLRKVIGEMVILRVEPNASTALIIYSSQDVMLGDNVELK